MEAASRSATSVGSAILPAAVLLRRSIFDRIFSGALLLSTFDGWRAHNVSSMRGLRRIDCWCPIRMHWVPGADWPAGPGEFATDVPCVRRSPPGEVSQCCFHRGCFHRAQRSRLTAVSLRWLVDNRPAGHALHAVAVGNQLIGGWRSGVSFCSDLPQTTPAYPLDNQRQPSMPHMPLSIIHNIKTGNLKDLASLLCLLVT